MPHRHKSVIITPEMASLHEYMRIYACELRHHPMTAPKIQADVDIMNNLYSDAWISKVDKAFQPFDANKVTRSVHLIAWMTATYIDKEKAIKLLDVALNVAELNQKTCLYTLNIFKRRTCRSHLTELKDDILKLARDEGECSYQRRIFQKI